jgi:hypothetical protein
MKNNLRLWPVLLTLCCSASQSGEWSGYVQGEWLYFNQDPISSEQHDSYLSVAVEPEYSHEWDNGHQSFTFVPFLRVSQHDDERTHADIRELTWLKDAGDWELRLGVRKVFWGVTEGAHLVDIINQTDLVENLDTEDKLGQPMINLALKPGWGTLDFFVLTGFRERTFPGEEGRPRTLLTVDTDHPEYESGAEELRTDAAIRWSHTLGSFDFGLTHFSGTSREPRLVVTPIGPPPGPNLPPPVTLIPHYDVIDQTSLDVQGAVGNWLWKFEWFTRSGFDDRYSAATGGFEYTFVGIGESQHDIGILMEYIFDDRGDKATTAFEDDILIGGRWTPNDEQNTQLLVGLIFDADSDAMNYNIEASRRFGEDWTIALEARGVSSPESNDVQYGLRRDDYIRLEINRYF